MKTKSTRHLGVKYLLALLLTLFFSSSFAQTTYYWIGATSGSQWTTNTNWSLSEGGASAGVVPGSEDIAVFPITRTLTVTGANINVKSIQVGKTGTTGAIVTFSGTAASVNIGSTGFVVIPTGGTSGIADGGNTISLNGTITVPTGATFTHSGTGKMVLGSTGVTIGGGTATISFGNLELASSVNVTVNGNNSITVIGNLTLNSGSNLTLPFGSGSTKTLTLGPTSGSVGGVVSGAGTITGGATNPPSITFTAFGETTASTMNFIGTSGTTNNLNTITINKNTTVSLTSTTNLISLAGTIVCGGASTTAATLNIGTVVVRVAGNNMISNSTTNASTFTITGTTGLVRNVRSVNSAVINSMTNAASSIIVSKLNINSSSLVTAMSLASTGNLIITDSLTFTKTTAMTLTTNGTLVLRSTSDGTAAISNLTYSTGNYIVISGNITVERYIPSSGRRRYVLVGSPVTSTINAGWQEGSTGGTFTTVSGYGASITGGVAQGTNGFDGPASSASGIFTYNDALGSGSKWSALSNTTDAASLAPGKGYLLFVRGDRSSNLATTPGISSNTTLRATGTVGQGSVSPTLLTGASKYTLIANPYPCAIDWNSGSLTKTNLTSSFTVYDANNSVFVSSNGTVKTPSIGNQQAGYIQSGQAFFVQNTEAGNGAITFTEAAKTTAATTSSSTTVFGEDANKAQLNINVYRTADNSFADGVVVLFGNNYKTAVDSKEDIYKFTNLSETFGLRRNNTVLGLEARPKVQSTDTTYFSLKSFAKKSYKLVLDGNNFEQTTSAKLEDKFTGTSTAIDVNGTTTYNFTVSDDAASSSNDRFIITFGSTAASTVITDGTAATSLYVKMSPNPVRNQLQVSFKTATAEATNIKVVNSLGQVVKTVNAGKVATGNVSVPVSELATGVYTVQLISAGKVVSTQQVVKAEN